MSRDFSNYFGPRNADMAFISPSRLNPGDVRNNWRCDVQEWVFFTKQRDYSGKKISAANLAAMVVCCFMLSILTINKYLSWREK